ncbi:biotin--[acetyl-CoA-carboxylase] ligase [Flavobacterium pallidum]|uniref:Biotin--[acetyl-CoA-carboxylase] ligase n=1 Tax=Flavobacterium pallidum TaxID=2172098 RepID=A0A2S1SK12_9FLAO|nr:biotin--[acetyl-CoA-carboxylase] ligase [Flavobacterium pallidum]AWI26701.1 biotin--[acetyl-CoA-carboxylase] ligase [Flavobacterium pallidum]
MHLIKLSAIDSTNDYLKQLNAQNEAESFTVVTAEIQTAGRGQMGSKWLTEPGKNLITSILIKDVLTSPDQIFLLNAAVAVSITQALKKFGIPGLSIKWPNDILSANKKISGILIENSFRNDGRIDSVIGIGLNVNQSDFSDLPRASSLLNIIGTELNKEQILFAIVEEMKRSTVNGLSMEMWHTYNNFIFRLHIPTAFEADGQQFMGIIKGVGTDGKLEVTLEDDSVRRFGIKEIEMLY